MAKGPPPAINAAAIPMAARPPIAPLLALTKFQTLPKIPGALASSAGVGAPPVGFASSATGGGIEAPPGPTVGAGGPASDEAPPFN